MPGDLDGTFGSGGLATAPSSLSDQRAPDVAIQSDGKVVIFGGASESATFRLMVARFLSNGSPDTQFGTGGVADTASVSANVIARAGSIDSAGRLLITGENVDNNELVIARITSTGQLDTGFNTTGWASRNLNGLGGQPRAVITQAGSGRVIIGGYIATLERFALLGIKSDGSAIADNSWGPAGQNGVVTTDVSPGNMSGINSLFELPSTNLLAVGWTFVGTQKAIALARYLSTGLIDTGFATNGIALSLIAGDSVDVRSAALDSSGRVYVALTLGSDIGVARLSSEGALDPTFGTGGIARLVVSGGAHAYDVAIAPDGKVVLAGGVGDGAASTAFLIARFSSGGQIDGTFGTGGIATKTFPPEPTLEAVAVGADNKILGAGEALGKATVARYIGTGDPAVSKITSPSKSKLKRKKFTKISGSAGPNGGVAKVEIAIRRIDARQLGKKRCVWIKSNKGAVKRVKDKTKKCASQLWLPASGKTKWSFKLKRKLPAGSYRIYSRTTLTNGVAQQRFSTKSKSLRKLKLTN